MGTARVLLLAACAVYTARGSEPVALQDFPCTRANVASRWFAKDRIVATCYSQSPFEQSADLYLSTDTASTWEKQVVCGNNENPCVVDFWQLDTHRALVITAHGVKKLDVAPTGGWIDVTDSAGAKVWLNNFELHPTIKGRILGTMPTLAGNKRLYLSDNYGLTFKPLDIPLQWIDSGTWGAPSATNYHPDVLFVVSLAGSWGKLSAYNIATGELSLVRDEVRSVQRFGAFLFFFVSDRTGLELYVSNSNGQRISKTVFPTTEESDIYSIAQISEQEVFVVAHHADCAKGLQAPWGKMYQSDRSGEYYSLCVENVRWNVATRKADLHPVGGMDGVYITAVSLFRNGTDNVLEEECAACDSAEACARVCRFKSIISWDNGEAGSWVELNPPADAAADACAGCKLQLHDEATDDWRVSAIKSKEDSPGLIIGVGNVGEALDNSPSALNVYLSRDAGETWSTILHGPHHFDWVNYGGFIVAATTAAGQTVQWSTDFGSTWMPYKYANDGKYYVVFEVEAAGGRFNDALTPVFLLKAVRHSSLISEESIVDGDVVYFTVDLTSLKPADCSAPPAPKHVPEAGPYEAFVPKNYASEVSPEESECFMGAKMTYIRRKGAAQCWSKVTQAQMESRVVDRCSCTLDDYECDAGFRKIALLAGRHTCESELTHAKVWDFNVDRFVSDIDAHVPDECSRTETYMRSKGYQLRAGFKCDPKAPNSLDLVPVLTKCPHLKESEDVVGFIFLTVFLLCMAALMAIYVGDHMGFQMMSAARKGFEARLSKCWGRMLDLFGRSAYAPVVMYDGGEEESETESHHGREFRDAVPLTAVSRPEDTVEVDLATVPRSEEADETHEPPPPALHEPPRQQQQQQQQQQEASDPQPGDPGRGEEDNFMFD